MRPLSEIEHFKQIEFKVWLIYIGPVLLKEKAPRQLFERFSILEQRNSLVDDVEHLCRYSRYAFTSFLEEDGGSLYICSFLTKSPQFEPSRVVSSKFWATLNLFINDV